MNQGINIVLAIVGGVFLAMQGGLNAQLGIHLKSPVLATLVAFVFSSLFALIMVISSLKGGVDMGLFKNVPVYLWFSGAFFSVLGISLYYHTIPRLRHIYHDITGSLRAIGFFYSGRSLWMVWTAQRTL